MPSGHMEETRSQQGHGWHCGLCAGTVCARGDGDKEDGPNPSWERRVSETLPWRGQLLCEQGPAGQRGAAPGSGETFPPPSIRC